MLACYYIDENNFMGMMMA